MLQFRSGTARGLVVTAVLGLAVPLTAQTPETRPLSRADAFIKAFGRSPSSMALRTSQLEQEEQVRLAFYGIDATRAQIAAGPLTEHEGNFIIDGFEQTIRDYVHDRSNDALVIAATGQASDIPSIAQKLGPLLSVARQDGLLGHEELAREAQARMIRILTTFSQKFAETCEQQNFPAEVALGLERQNQMLGTGVSVSHCANRKVSTDISSQGIVYHFETCTLRGDGVWDLKISGPVVGTGMGEIRRSGEGHWHADVVFRGYAHGSSGELILVKEEVEQEETPAAVPNDAGPHAKPNGWPPEPPVYHPIPEKIIIQKLRTTTIFLVGSGGFEGYTAYWQRWAEGEIKREDKPCRSSRQ